VLWIISLAWSIAALTFLAHPRIAPRFAGLAARLAGCDAGGAAWRAFAACALTAALIGGAFIVLRAPVAWAGGFFIEHEWGLSTQSAASFLWDWAKGLALSTVIYAIGLGSILTLRSVATTWWPLIAWGVVSVLVLFLVFIWPVVVDPLFHDFTAVGETDLRQRVESVADRAGLEVGEVMWMDASTKTKRLNAFFTGLGATKRIVLWDTLKDAGLDEIETIVAHEAGHWKYGHMWKGTLIALVGIGAFMGLLWLVFRSGSSWIPDAALPRGGSAAVIVLLLVVVARTLTMPIENGISRSWERQADRASLELSDKPDAFIEAEVKLARGNLSNIEPGPFTVFWFYSHPPVMERITMGERYKSGVRGEELHER
jgi:STE24 endopeptidase